MKVRLSQRSNVADIDDLFRKHARSHIESGPVQRRLDPMQRKALVTYIPRLQATFTSVLEANVELDEDEPVPALPTREEVAELQRQVLELRRKVSRMRVELYPRIRSALEQHYASQRAVSKTVEVEMPVAENAFADVESAYDWDGLARRTRRNATESVRVAKQLAQALTQAEHSLKAYEKISRERLGPVEQSILREQGADYVNYAHTVGEAESRPAEKQEGGLLTKLSRFFASNTSE